MAVDSSLETGALHDYIEDVLKADAQITALVAGRVYWGMAPQGAIHPLIVWQVVAGTDTNVVGTGDNRLFTKPLVLVKAITQGNAVGLAITIASHVDRVLHGIENQPKTSLGRNYVISCYRESPFEMPEFGQNQRYNHFGGHYRFHVEEI